MTACRFVIKTVDEKGRKVFINVCGSSSVLAPGGWKNGQVTKPSLQFYSVSATAMPVELCNAFVRYVMHIPIALVHGFTSERWQMSEEVRTALERAELEDPGDILRFPLSMGDLRMDRDHSGEACHVLDIVFNIDVLKQAQTFRSVTLSSCLPIPGFIVPFNMRLKDRQVVK